MAKKSFAFKALLLTLHCNRHLASHDVLVILFILILVCPLLKLTRLSHSFDHFGDHFGSLAKGIEFNTLFHFMALDSFLGHDHIISDVSQAWE